MGCHLADTALAPWPTISVAEHQTATPAPLHTRPRSRRGVHPRPQHIDELLDAAARVRRRLPAKVPRAPPGRSGRILGARPRDAGVGQPQVRVADGQGGRDAAFRRGTHLVAGPGHHGTLELDAHDGQGGVGVGRRRNWGVARRRAVACLAYRYPRTFEPKSQADTSARICSGTSSSSSMAASTATRIRIS